MKNTTIILAIAVVAVIGYFAYVNFKSPTSENTGDSMQGKLDINVICEGALAYMTFPDAASADQFVAECKEGKHPEVIEQYKAQMNLGDGAAL